MNNAQSYWANMSYLGYDYVDGSANKNIEYLNWIYDW